MSYKIVSCAPREPPLSEILTQVLPASSAPSTLQSDECATTYFTQSLAGPVAVRHPTTPVRTGPNPRTRPPNSCLPQRHHRASQHRHRHRVESRRDAPIPTAPPL